RPHPTHPAINTTKDERPARQTPGSPLGSALYRAFAVLLTCASALEASVAAQRLHPRWVGTRRGI
ncbi:hypothetical protein OSI77_18690, partial [Mycobacterium ulcerans]